MKIYKKKDKIIIEIPFWSKRMNPYMIDENGKPEDVGEYPTLTGLICKDKDGNEEMGFAQTIDMCYADKPDQVNGWLVRWYGDEEDFVAKCKELGIGIEDARDL